MSTGVASVSMLPCSCFEGNERLNSATKGRESTAEGFTYNQAEMRKFEPALLASVPRASRPASSSIKSGGVQKGNHSPNGVRLLHRHLDTVPTPYLSSPESDLSKYHFFCVVATESDSSQDNRTRQLAAKRSHVSNSDSRAFHMIKHDRWSWSNAYSAFDYWCFYRIEFLRYQLKRALYQQHLRSRGDTH